MRVFYFTGSAFFIGLTAYQLKTPNSEVFLALFAFSAVLGFFGEIGNRKLIMPLLGFGANGYFLLLNFLNTELAATNIQLFGLAVGAIWMLLILIFWKKDEVKVF